MIISSNKMKEMKNKNNNQKHYLTNTNFKLNLLNLLLFDPINVYSNLIKITGKCLCKIHIFLTLFSDKQ